VTLDGRAGMLLAELYVKDYIVKYLDVSFAVKRILFNIVRTTSNDVITSCQLYFNFTDVGLIVPLINAISTGH